MLVDEIKAGETDTLEFKRDVPSDKLRLLKTACAFANSNGGRIVVGVDDDRTVVGVDEMSAFKLADQLIDTISNGCEPQVPVSSEVATVEGKTVIVLTVQMGLHCPYHVKSAGVENGTFVRVGATSRLVDEDSLKELEIIGRGRCFDSMVCRGLDTSQAEVKRLCSKMYRLARENCDDDAERKKIRKVGETQLEDWNILVRRGEKLQPSYAFALLVGSKKFHSEMKCGFFKGTTRATFLDRKEFAGSILDQIDQAYEFVLAKINRGMEIVGTRRKDVYEIPPSVIRELIINAVVHRLYVNPRAMATTVAVYEDRVEVTSPGGLPHGMSLEMMATGHSKSRNKSLALAFKYMNFIEEWGSGIPRIQKLLSKAGLPPLHIENNGMDIRFTVLRSPEIQAGTSDVEHNVNLDAMMKVSETMKKVLEERQIGTEENRITTEEKNVTTEERNATTEENRITTEEKNVTTEETTTRDLTCAEKTECILDLIRTQPFITAKELAKRCGMTEDGMFWKMKQLKAKGVIRRVGATKGGHWEVVE